MSQVWKSDSYDGGTLLVLLALADWADDDGGSIFPKVATIGRKARLSERQVQNCLKALRDDGVLTQVVAARRGRGTEYRLNIDRVKNLHRNDCGATGSANGVQPAAVLGVKRAAPPIEPPVNPPENHHSLTPDGERETVAVLGLSDQDSWPEARSAFANTWPDGFPADGENACRIEFEKITRIRPAEIIIGCIRAHGAALVERKAKRVGMPGPFAFKQPRNWLKQGDWQGYIPAVEQATQVETEETLALARVQATLGPGVVKILKEVGVTVGEIARLEGVTFEDGPPPRFVTVRPFQAARLRQRADKLERELGEGLLIIEGAPERKSA